MQKTDKVILFSTKSKLFEKPQVQCFNSMHDHLLNLYTATCKWDILQALKFAHSQFNIYKNTAIQSQLVAGIQKSFFMPLPVNQCWVELLGEIY